jgi:thymidylate synthase
MNNNLTNEEAIAIQKLLRKLGHEDMAAKLVTTPQEEEELFCETCGFPVHPCLPCSEIVAFHNHVDDEYFGLLRLILEEGRVKKNRTGIDTIGVFGAQAKFDVDMDAFPILTTKKIFFKGIVHELLWFIRGETNIKYLIDNGVHIWDEWAYVKFKKDGWLGETNYASFIHTQAEFISKLKELPKDDWFVTKFGDLGEGTYGGMWRAFPYADCSVGECSPDSVDQLKKVIDKLKTNPDDRRMIVSAWHPYWVDHCALPPCHCLFHFNTEELTLNERIQIMLRGKTEEECKQIIQMIPDNLIHYKIPTRRLNCLLYQRSCDTGLGVPYNITSYCLLTAMIAHCLNMEPGVFTHTYGDLHIYSNHIDQLKGQLKRVPKKLPKLWLNPQIKNLFDFRYEDIRLENYESHPSIKMDVAV